MLEEPLLGPSNTRTHRPLGGWGGGVGGGAGSPGQLFQPADKNRSSELDSRSHGAFFSCLPI